MTNGRKARSESGEPGGPRSITNPLSSAGTYLERERPEGVATRFSLVPFTKFPEENCDPVSAFEVEPGQKSIMEAAASARKRTRIFRRWTTSLVIASETSTPLAFANPSGVEVSDAMTRDVVHRRKILVLFLALAAASMMLFWPGSTSKADTGSQFSSGNFVNGTRENLVATPSGLSLSKYVPAEERGLVIDLGPPGSPDSDRAFLPFVMQDSDGSFKMWYTGYDGTRNRLLYANSTDGLRWTKQGVAIDIFQPPLMLDGVTGGSVLKEAGTYHMWFTGTSWGVGPAGYTDRIYHTESPDARNWSSPTLALDFGASGMWGSWYVLYPSVLRDANDVLRMYYTGGDCAPPNCLGFGIGLATSTNTSSVFDRWSGNPLLRQGAPSTWDADGYAGTSIGYPTWRLYTEGSQAQHFTIGVASSNDCYNWRFEGDQPLFRPNTAPAWESVGVGGPSLVESLGWLYYSGSNGYNWRIGLAQLNPDSYRDEGSYQSQC